jgi:hypothetical protein
LCRSDSRSGENTVTFKRGGYLLATINPSPSEQIFGISGFGQDTHFRGNDNISLSFQHHILPHSLVGGPLPEKRPKLLPLPHERIMIYVRQETEEAYTPLHLVLSH